jgi:SOS-response transcriptional repressor LexA
MTTAKNINLNPGATKRRNVALVGQAAAGDPVDDGVIYLPFIKWLEVDIPGWATELDHFFCVEIVGTSLVNDGVRDGDIALIYATNDVREGDLAAVRTPFGPTVKYIFAEGENLTRLEGANDTYKARLYENADVFIQGRVISWQPAEQYRIASNA